MNKACSVSLTALAFLVMTQPRVALAQAPPSGLLVTTHLLGYHIPLAGRDLNGRDLNGRVLDGHGVMGVLLEAALLDGEPLQSLRLESSALKGVDGQGRDVGSRDLVGLMLTAILDDGTSLFLRIDGVDKSPDRANKDVYLYQVSYPTLEEWRPLCGLDEEGLPLPAIPLNGLWDYGEGIPGGGSWNDDPSAFTFACQGYVLAKCVEAGYHPWRRAKIHEKHNGNQTISLADHHQACTRMLRADYCGDGRSYTADNILVNLYDGLGVRYDSADWPLEAEWDAGGAICLAEERLLEAVPPCLEGLVDDQCGQIAHFNEGTLLISEVGPSEP